MPKKMKVLSSVLVAVLLLTVGGATMAMAQEEEESEPEEDELTTEVEELIPELAEVMPRGEANGLLARVAEILDIPVEELREAFQQAREEMREERFEEALYQLLDKAVDEGLLSPEDAKEIKEWWAQKPEALNLGLLKRAFWAMMPHPEPLHRHGSMGIPEIRLHLRERFKQLPGPEMRQEILEKALEEGLISQEKVDAINEWQNSKPEALNRLSPRARIFKAIRGRHMIAVPKAWNRPIPQMAD